MCLISVSSMILCFGFPNVVDLVCFVLGFGIGFVVLGLCLGAGGCCWFAVLRLGWVWIGGAWCLFVVLGCGLFSGFCVSAGFVVGFIFVLFTIVVVCVCLCWLWVLLCLAVCFAFGVL